MKPPRNALITPEVRKRLAKITGLHEQYLYQCLSGRRDMSPLEAARAEVATAGVLTRQMLCTQSFAEVWPELAEKEAAAEAAARAERAKERAAAAGRPAPKAKRADPKVSKAARAAWSTRRKRATEAVDAGQQEAQS